MSSIIPSDLCFYDPEYARIFIYRLDEITALPFLFDMVCSCLCSHQFSAGRAEYHVIVPDLLFSILSFDFFRPAGFPAVRTDKFFRFPVPEHVILSCCLFKEPFSQILRTTWNFSHQVHEFHFPVCFTSFPDLAVIAIFQSVNSLPRAVVPRSVFNQFFDPVGVFPLQFRIIVICSPFPISPVLVQCIQDATFSPPMLLFPVLMFPCLAVDTVPHQQFLSLIDI